MDFLVQKYFLKFITDINENYKKVFFNDCG